MTQFSALITTTTECWVVVDASDAVEAREKIERGEVRGAGLWTAGGLSFAELLNDVVITDESFGEDT